MAPSCGTADVPYTLLSALLSGGGPACGGRAFLRDYAQRGTNALLWAGLLAVTWVLLLRVSALFRLWALGSRLPGPPALLADPGLAAVCRAGGDVTEKRKHAKAMKMVEKELGLEDDDDEEEEQEQEEEE